MANSLFFADIDPNERNQGRSARQIRRLLMSRLLVWDSVVVSDSQMLQDPRFRLLMSPTMLQELSLSRCEEDQAFDDLEQWQGGFEQLLRSGLVEVACRERDHKVSELTETWDEMSRSETAVPFLTEGRGYAEYLEQIDMKKRSFSLSKVAARFRSNLQEGVERGAVRLDAKNPAFLAFQRMISAPVVQLRDILMLANERYAAGELTEAERDHLYQFSSQCYGVNVPAETDCYTSAKLARIPLFLPSGTFDNVDSTSFLDQSKIRSSWALDPAALDLMPIEAFVELRQSLREEFESGLLLKAQEGNLADQAEANLYYDVWASYVDKLEKGLRRALRMTRDEINEITRKDFMSAQEHLENSVSEIIVNHILSRIPVVGGILNVIEMGREITDLRDSLIIFNQKQAQAYFKRYHDDIQRYMDELFDNNSSIITKY